MKSSVEPLPARPPLPRPRTPGSARRSFPPPRSGRRSPGCGGSPRPSPRRPRSARGPSGGLRPARRVTGLKVPIPTWRVTRAMPIPAAAISVQQILREVKAGGGSGDGAGGAGEDGLVALAVLGVVRTRGCRAAAGCGPAGRGGARRARRSAGGSGPRPCRRPQRRDHLEDDPVPGRARRPGLTRASHSPLARASRPAGSPSCPPPARRPKRRAGITRVSLSTRRSPGAQQAGEVAHPAVAVRSLGGRAPAGGSRRAARAPGRCALRRQLVVEVAGQHVKHDGSTRRRTPRRPAAPPA